MNSAPNISNDIDRLQDAIDEARIELLRVAKQRDEEEARFKKIQLIHTERQRICMQGFKQYMQRPRLVLPVQYTKSILDLSNICDSRYVIAREAELCRTLHLVKIYANQLDLHMKHHKMLVDPLKERLEDESKIREDIENILLRTIKFVSIDFARRIIRNRAILVEQQKALCCIQRKNRLSILALKFKRRNSKQQMRRISIDKQIIQAARHFETALAA